ncbi:MAG: hypothetical protein ACKO22_05160 [Cyanobium sp.]
MHRSYVQAAATLATNAMVTISHLEALRALEEPCASVLITTDKLYRNNEGSTETAKTIPRLPRPVQQHQSRRQDRDVQLARQHLWRAAAPDLLSAHRQRPRRQRDRWRRLGGRPDRAGCELLDAASRSAFSTRPPPGPGSMC